MEYELIGKTAEFHENLSKSVIKSGFWVFLLRIVQQLLYFAKLIILAHILAPSDFGLMGVVLLTLAAIDTFSETGLQNALIQKKSNTEAYLNSVWTVLLFRGFFIFTIIFFLAPYIAIFFKMPEAGLLIKAAGLVILFRAFTNIGIVYFQKDLKFHKQFFYQFTETLADFVFSVGAALLFKNVWAMILGLIAGNIAGCIASYVICSYKPRLSWDFKKIKELWHFSRWIFGSTILVFLIMQGDDIFVGKLIGAAALGFYQMAYLISNAPATEISLVMNRITFPAFSKLQDSPDKLREAYLKTLQLTSFLSFPLAGLIIVLGHDFTMVFLKEKWIPIVSLMQVLAVWGAVRSVGNVATLARAVGRPKLETQCYIIQLLTLAILIYPLFIKLGIIGVALSVIFSSIIARIVSISMIMKIIKCRIDRFIKITGLPLMAATVMVLFTSVLKSIIGLGGVAGLVIYSASGVLIYFGIIMLCDKYFDYKMKPILIGSFAELLK